MDLATGSVGLEIGGLNNGISGPCKMGGLSNGINGPCEIGGLNEITGPWVDLITGLVAFAGYVDLITGLVDIT